MNEDEARSLGNILLAKVFKEHGVDKLPQLRIPALEDQRETQLRDELAEAQQARDWWADECQRMSKRLDDLATAARNYVEAETEGRAAGPKRLERLLACIREAGATVVATTEPLKPEGALDRKVMLELHRRAQYAEADLQQTRAKLSKVEAIAADRQAQLVARADSHVDTIVCQRDTARRFIRERMRHTAPCAYAMRDGASCSCGLSAAVGRLAVFTNETDWVVAHDVDDAWSVWCETTGEVRADYEEHDPLVELDAGADVKLWATWDGKVAEQRGDGAELMARPASFWAEMNGRGFLASREE